MRTCSSCGEILGYTVKTCPFCGVSASKNTMTELKHERIKQDMIFEEYCREQELNEAHMKGFLFGWLLGRRR